MATTSILYSNGILKPSDYQAGATFLHDINAPLTNDVKSLINYYFAVQATDYVFQQTVNSIYYMTEKQKIERLISQVEDGSPTLLTFFTGNGGGHAVVAYGVEYGSYKVDKASYNAKILVYDNNAIDFRDDFCMYINTSSSNWVIPVYESASTTQGGTIGLTTDDLATINYHGYLDEKKATSTEEYIPTLNSKAINSDYSLRRINMSTNGFAFTITADTMDDIKLFAPFHG